MAVNDMVVRILGDSRSVERAFARSSKAANQFNTNVETTGAKIDKNDQACLGVREGRGGRVRRRVRADRGDQRRSRTWRSTSPPNLQEQISKTNVVFEGSADTVKEWAKTTASSIGIGERRRRWLAASTFGAMFDQAGASSQRPRNCRPRRRARRRPRVVQQHLADETLTALRSGLSGEIEPLRRFQVFLTKAAVAQRAMGGPGIEREAVDAGREDPRPLQPDPRADREAAGRLREDDGRTGEPAAHPGRQVRELQGKSVGLLLPAMARYVGGRDRRGRGVRH